MDFNLKQWRDQQQESEEEQQQQPSAKIPRQLFLETPQHQHQQQEAASAALPLFVYSHSEPQSNKITTHFSPSSSCSSSTTPSGIPRFPRVGGGCGFSISQWQELELQALIFKHMIAGAAVPQELLQLVKKSLLTSSASPFYNLHHYPPHFQPAALAQAGYWGKGAMDPEPGRCRRTDGKKWRCSRDVVAGHKYCERHMHRGRNRSRKPVEFPASAGSGGAAGGSLNKSSTTATIVSGSSGGCGGGGGGSGGAQFSLSGPGPSLDAFQLNQGSSKLNSDEKSSNKVLMHFFDDWPRSNNAETNDNSSSICLSISNTTNSTSDFLRLSTGNGIELGERDGNGNGNEERQRGQLNWGTGWGANPAASMGMGGPLAEALRSSTHSSPTSVLHQLPRVSDADTSYVTA